MKGKYVEKHGHEIGNTSCQYKQMPYIRQRGGGCAKLRGHHIAGGNPAEQGLENHS